jgi:Ankyrin repeats (3 copies)
MLPSAEDDDDEEDEEPLVSRFENLRLQIGGGVKERNRSLFFTRCVNNKRAQVQSTLANLADPNQLTRSVDAGGSTALILAEMEGHLRIIKLLHQNGAELNHVNAKGRTALMEAALWGYLSVARYLLENGADYALRDRKGRLAEDFATTANRNVREREPYLPLRTTEPTKDHRIILSIVRARAPSPALPRVPVMVPVMPSRYTRFSIQGTFTTLISDVAEWNHPGYKSKTIGVLFRGGAISAKSGWTHCEDIASQDGLVVLNGNTWTEEVLDLSKRLGFELKEDSQKNHGQPGRHMPVTSKNNSWHISSQSMLFSLTKLIPRASISSLALHTLHLACSKQPRLSPAERCAPTVENFETCWKGSWGSHLK